MVEGPKVLGEALAAGAPVESVYLDPAAGADERRVADEAAAAGCRVFDLAAGVLERVAGTVTPQGVLGVVGFVDVALEAVPDGLVVVCADVRDPGNVGTVLRSASASGAAGVVLCDGSVDVYNPKAVRASAGAVFHVPVVAGGDPGAALDALGARGLARLGTTAHGGPAHTEVDLARPTALVLGNEATGLPAGIDAHLDGSVHIPMEGRAESLNVGMAAAVLCFEAARQRAAAVGRRG